MRVRLLASVAFVVAYVYAFPYFGALRHANELPRILATEELVDHGTFRIDARLKVDPAPEPVSFDTLLQIGSGEFRVKGE